MNVAQFSTNLALSGCALYNDFLRGLEKFLGTYFSSFLMGKILVNVAVTGYNLEDYLKSLYFDFLDITLVRTKGGHSMQFAFEWIRDI